MKALGDGKPKPKVIDVTPDMVIGPGDRAYTQSSRSGGIPRGRSILEDLDDLISPSAYFKTFDPTEGPPGAGRPGDYSPPGGGFSEHIKRERYVKRESPEPLSELVRKLSEQAAESAARLTEEAFLRTMTGGVVNWPTSKDRDGGG